MDDLKFVVTKGEPKPENLQALSSGLLAHHASQGHPRTWEKYSVFLTDKNDKAYAGVIVTFMWNGMHIDSLWVDGAIRGKKWGSKLMGLVEDEARKRGCTIAYTDTFSWQATDFYEKLGYTLYGKLEGFPENDSLSYYSKRLT